MTVVCKFDDIESGTAKRFDVNGTPVAVVRIDDEVFAIGDICSHASTVGPIDEDQLFYLESRGVRPDVAQRLVVLGFFDEVIAQLPVGDLAQLLRADVAQKLSIGGAS